MISNVPNNYKGLLAIYKKNQNYRSPLLSRQGVESVKNVEFFLRFFGYKTLKTTVSNEQTLHKNHKQVVLNVFNFFKSYFYFFLQNIRSNEGH